MSDRTENIHQDVDSPRFSWLYGRIGIMAGAAVVLSGAIIVYFNRYSESHYADGLGTYAVMAVDSLMPYMISAVVAAITAIGIITIIPLLSGYRSTKIIQERLRYMADGDLSSKVYINEKNSHLSGLVHELNGTVERLGHEIAEWKIINRSQWEHLEMIRMAVLRKDFDTILENVEIMEKNWEKVAGIEQKLMTG